MSISIVAMQASNQAFIREGIEIYLSRLQHYHSVEWIELKTSKKNSYSGRSKEEEAKKFMKYLKPGDRLVLLDEQGSEFSSKQLAGKMESWLNQSGRIVFFIGGPFGFSKAIYQRADFKLSLSKLTLPHQLDPLIFS